MALKPCKECEAKVSKNSFACPKCGSSDPTGVGEKFLKIFFTTIIVLFITFVVLMSVSSASEPESSEIVTAKKEIRGEEKVKDLSYDPSATVQWHIGVIDDGSKRYGYASYICEVLKEHDLVSQNTSVRIVDIVKVMQGTNFRKASLGRVDCTTYQHHDP